MDSLENWLWTGSAPEPTNATCPLLEASPDSSPGSSGSTDTPNVHEQQDETEIFDDSDSAMGDLLDEDTLTLPTYVSKYHYGTICTSRHLRSTAMLITMLRKSPPVPRLRTNTILG